MRGERPFKQHNIEIGMRLRLARLNRGWAQCRVAKYLQVTPYPLGKRSIPLPMP
jgi:transcriptional regulator with XRE-family HTH domain